MSGNIEYKVKPNKKRIATSFIAYICSFLYFTVALLVIIGAVYCVMKRFQVSLACLTGVVIIVVVLRLIDIRYYWFLNEVLRVKNGKLVFTYDQIISSLGRTGVKDEIVKLTSYKVTKNKIILYGEINHSEPLQKPKSKNKLDIPKNFENYDELIKRLDSYVHNK